MTAYSALTPRMNLVNLLNYGLLRYKVNSSLLDSNVFTHIDNLQNCCNLSSHIKVLILGHISVSNLPPCDIRTDNSIHNNSYLFIISHQFRA